MSDSRAAGSLDRLPWLSDEPAPKRSVRAKRGRLDLLGWISAALLVIAGLSFWVGTKSHGPEIASPVSAPVNKAPAVEQTRPAPAPEIRLAPQPQVVPVPAPEVRTAPVPQVRIAVPPVRHVVTREVAKPVAADEQASASTKTETKADTPAAAAKLTPWPPRVVAGAYGRLVQIGAFGSVDQAKQGWRYMVRTYPAVAHLPAVVRPDRNSKGRMFYRFRIGTTSQAHSEVLCQRMQNIHFSCAVVGLPWKAKVER